MYFFKCAVFLVLVCGQQLAAASPCETLSGITGEIKVCWSDKINGWISEACQSKPCKALDYFEKSSPARTASPASRNPAAQVCKDLGNEVVILRDKSRSEQTYCQFKDKSVVSTSTLDKKNL